VLSMRALVERLRAEAELMDRDEGGDGPMASRPAGQRQPPTRGVGSAGSSAGGAAGGKPTSAPASTTRSAWRVLVALDQAALRLRRNGVTFVEAQLCGLMYHSDLNEEYEGECGLKGGKGVDTLSVMTWWDALIPAAQVPFSDTGPRPKTLLAQNPSTLALAGTGLMHPFSAR